MNPELKKYEIELNGYLQEFVDLLLEKEERPIVVVYAGRFQPFHAGHYSVYELLVNKFGASNVYIGTSDITDPETSPMSFHDKQEFIHSMFGIPKDKIVQIKNPYTPVELLHNKPKNTALVVAVGEKDADRLSGKYFTPYKAGKSMEPYRDRGYAFTAPDFKLDINGVNVSGTALRNIFRNPKIKDSTKKNIFTKVYGKFNPRMFDFLVKKLNTKKSIDSTQRIINPETKRKILVKTALSYPKEHPAHRAAEKLTEDILLEGVHDPGILKAVILAGGPGSGKSYASRKLFDVSRNLYFGASGMKVVDQDRVFEHLLKKKGYDLDLTKLPEDEFLKITDTHNPTSPRAIAKSITNKMYHNYIQNRLGVIIDGTASNLDKVLEEKHQLENHGYDVKVMFVNTPLRLALQRNKQRARSLPESIVKDKWYEAKENLRQLQKLFGHQNVMVIDNSSPDIDKQFEKITRTFMTNPVQNPKGQQWIRSELGDKADNHPLLKNKNREELLNRRVKNPLTKRNILVKTALGYTDEHPAHQTAEKILHAYANEVKEEVKMISRALFLTEGGAAGHMSHIFEDYNLTFGDLKTIVDLGLTGKLDIERPVTEKLDGQNIMVSYRHDKGVIFARNAGQIKGFGSNALSSDGIKQMFAGRGDVQEAFSKAADDIESGILSLSDKQKDKLFNNGSRFISLEILYPKTQNVIPYDVNMLVLHNVTEFDKDGRQLSTDSEAARSMAGMLRQINADIQQTFTFRGPVVVSLPPSQNLSRYKSKFISKIKRLQSEFNLSDSAPVSEYHRQWWGNLIDRQAAQFKYSLTNNIREGLINRWAAGDNAFSLNDMKKYMRGKSQQSPDYRFFDWAINFDKTDKNKIAKENIAPFELIFMELGSLILQHAQGLINVASSSDSIKKDLDKAINTLSSSSDESAVEKFREQMNRLNSLNLDNLVPSEGIVFMYKGKIYKLTGLFAPINQILGALKY